MTAKAAKEWRARMQQIPEWVEQQRALGRERDRARYPAERERRLLRNRAYRQKLKETPEGRAAIHKINSRAAAKYRKKNLRRIMFNNAKKRAEQKGLEFDIELKDIVIPKLCPIFGIELECNKTSRNNSPSLDRVDNSLGYIKGNIAVISNRANKLKSSATKNELKAIIGYMERHNAVEALTI
jgi:hypothetical protein